MSIVMEITPDETELGFEHHEGRGVVLALGRGLYAVKVHQTGAVHYAICDGELSSIYPHASSLEELRERFDLQKRRAGAL